MARLQNTRTGTVVRVGDDQVHKYVGYTLLENDQQPEPVVDDPADPPTDPVAPVDPVVTTTDLKGGEGGDGDGGRGEGEDDRDADGATARAGGGAPRRRRSAAGQQDS